MTTTSVVQTIKEVLDKADPNTIADAFRKMLFGTMMTPIDETITLAAVATTVNLLTQSTAKKAALFVRSVRVTDVTGGASDVGDRIVSDAGGTPAAKAALAAGVCTLSADGTLLTFDATILKVRVVWFPVPDTALTTVFAPVT